VGVDISKHVSQKTEGVRKDVDGSLILNWMMNSSERADWIVWLRVSWAWERTLECR